MIKATWYKVVWTSFTFALSRLFARYTFVPNAGGRDEVVSGAG
jgi:hypothetical protein